MLDGLDSVSRATLAKAEILLKLYDVEAKVAWRPYRYSGWSRHRMKKAFVLYHGGIRWVLNSGNRWSMLMSYRNISSYVTAENLMVGVKRLVNKVND